MNRIKATIATAAVVTCCLGNNSPAQAQADPFEAGYHYGYAYGQVTGTCLTYIQGAISYDTLVKNTDLALEIRGVTDHASQVIKNRIESNYANLVRKKKLSHEGWRSCLAAIRQVLDQTQPSNGYSRADYGN